MPVIPAAPLFISDAKYTIAGNDYEFSISSAQVTASTSTVTFTGSAPGAVYSASTAATRTLVLSFAQDWDTEDSLSRTLENLKGQRKTVTIEPRKGGTGVTGTVIIVPGPFGDATNKHATATVTMGFVGDPVFTYAPPTVPED